MARIETNFAPAISFYLAGVKGVICEVAEEILVAAKAEVPVDTSKLQMSGEIFETATGTFIQFRALNGDYDYAVRQHEDVTLNHPNGGKDHYLSDPALRISQSIPERIVERMGGTAHG